MIEHAVEICVEPVGFIALQIVQQMQVCLGRDRDAGVPSASRGKISQADFSRRIGGPWDRPTLMLPLNVLPRIGARPASVRAGCEQPQKLLV